ncbi:MAG: hypothetical protein Q8R35_00895 [bacterium]|nr:hypothetical protein [bacterium]
MTPPPHSPKSFRQRVIPFGLLTIAVLLGAVVYRELEFSDIGWPARGAVPNGPPGGNDNERVRKVPDQRAPEEVKRAYYELVSRLAEPSSVLDITGCTAEPLALKVTEGDAISIRNTDAAGHTINIGQQKIPVPAKGAAMLTATFDTGPGIYGYGCDTGLSIIGVLSVTPR